MQRNIHKNFWAKSGINLLELQKKRTYVRFNPNVIIMFHQQIVRPNSQMLREFPYGMGDTIHLGRLDSFLAESELDAVWLAEPNSFAWLTGGDNVIDLSAPIGIAAAGYDGQRVEVITANNEHDRLREEELDADVTLHSFDWHETTLAEAVAERSARPAGADFDIAGFEDVDISRLRNPLTEEDIEVYRAISRDAALALESACRTLEPETTEQEAAGHLHRAFVECGLHVPCVLIGGAERAQRHRHFTPSSARLGSYAVVTAGVARSGLYDSITRIVAFDPPEWLPERHEAASRVHATAIAACQESRRAREVFAEIRNAYETVGYPDEWRAHHQGGAAGYAIREWIATPDGADRITLPMAFAWNPTVQGAKSEDTVLITEDDIDVLTRTGAWPTATYRSVDGSVALDLHDILVV